MLGYLSVTHTEIYLSLTIASAGLSFGTMFSKKPLVPNMVYQLRSAVKSRKKDVCEA